jgi:hypothetical protein
MVEQTTGAVILLLIFLVALLYFTSRVSRGGQPSLRRIQAFELLSGFAGRAVEAGRPFHLSLGIGSMADVTTADSLAGLSLLNYLADQSRLTGIHPVVSMANPTVMLFAQNVLRAAQDNTPAAEAAYRSVRWIAPQPAAYAAGVMSLLSLDQVEANVMIGDFGDEYLLMGETAARRGISHIGGASDPNVLPFIYASAQEPLLGEEIYATGAYLQKRASHIGSLLAQDMIRWLVALVILGGVLAASVGWEL